MSLLLDLEHQLLEYTKSLPDGVAEDSDFEVWGRGFCERVVCIICLISFLTDAIVF